jgi:hypothetical protein
LVLLYDLYEIGERFSQTLSGLLPPLSGTVELTDDERADTAEPYHKH